MLEELEEKKQKLIKFAEEAELRRNDLNAEASRWAAKRDELNKLTRELIDKAQEHKATREEFNKIVAENKPNRDKLNEESNKYYAEIDGLRKKHNMGSIRSFEELRKELDRLEFKQQVEVLKPDKERQIVDRITSLQKEFERRKREIAKNDKLKELLDKAQALREEAHAYHEKVTNAAKTAQEHHDLMLQTFREIDRIRKEADDAHRSFVDAQERADVEHKTFIKHRREIRDFDKLITGLKKKMREDYSFKDRIDSKKKAKEVYGQFKRGEKLSTEDLLLLQRSWMS